MIKTTVKIEGMVCGMCEVHINDCIRHAFHIKKVSSSQGRAETIILSEDALDADKLKSAIDATGYKAVSISSEEYVKKGIFNRR